MPDSDPSCRLIYYRWSKNTVDGISDGSHGPDLFVVRRQMAKFLTNA